MIPRAFRRIQRVTVPCRTQPPIQLREQCREGVQGTSVVTTHAEMVNSGRTLPAFI
jgi:hypothetical protein